MIIAWCPLGPARLSIQTLEPRAFNSHDFKVRCYSYEHDVRKIAFTYLDDVFLNDFIIRWNGCSPISSLEHKCLNSLTWN